MRLREWPLVSIVTPSYNQAAFIRETIASVKNQVYPNIEHIIMDGGSSDSTLKILKECESSYNMRWRSERDQGQAHAVNKGFEEAKGEIIGWLNSDDCYLDQQAVSSVVRVFDKHPSADVVYGDIVHIDANGWILRVQILPRFSYKRLLRSCFIEQPAVFFRRKVVEKYKLDTSFNYALDYEYWLRIAREFRFRHLPRVIAADRNHSSRKILSCGEELEQEVHAIRTSYAIETNTVQHVWFMFNVLLSSILRRLLGLAVLLQFYHKDDFAFTVHIGNVLHAAKRQLVGRSMKDLLKGEHN